MYKRKRLPSISTKDRISDLPDAIVCHILSFLPTNLAVSTSILSKRWKPVWLSVTTFDMYDSFPRQVLRSAMQAMLSRDIKLPILLFRLKCKGYDDRTLSKILRLIKSALRRGVQTLELSIFCRDLNMKTLSMILTCKTLTVLKLRDVYMDEEVPQINDSSIKTLHLDLVGFSADKHMINFFLAFPSVEILQTNHVYYYKQLIRKPMINCFRNLLRANVSDIQLIPLLSHSRELHLNVNQIPHLKIVRIPVFYHLSQMKLVFNFGETWDAKWKWILKMLQQSPNLGHLIIHEERVNKSGINEKNWEEPLIVPECLSTRLRTCLFRYYRGTKCELLLTKYVMQNSNVLDTMKIHTSNFISLNKKDEMLQKLSDCPRGCKLIFT